MGEKSVLFYLLIVVLAGGVVQSLGIGFLFFFKKSGVRRANAFYGSLLIAFGLTLLHNIFYITDWFQYRPGFSLLPTYFTLALPTLLFYYVKLDLYPRYQLKWSDSKHFILPISQFLFFVAICTKLVSFGSPLPRYFYNPFYGAAEQFLYLCSFFAYMYFAYRYIRQKDKGQHSRAEAKKIYYLKTLIQTLFFLFFIHSIFVVVDFVSFDFFNIDLRTIKPFAAMGVLSFAALVYWLGVYGLQVLIWGRKVFRPNQ